MDATLPGALGAAVALGLASSAHCVAMCGPLALVARGGAPWQLGRLVSYGALGTVAGLGGGAVFAVAAGQSARWIALGLCAGAVILAALQVAGVKLPAPGFVRGLGGLIRGAAGAEGRSRGGRLLLLGLANGLLPCGMVYAALPLAAATGTATAGAATLVAFGLGTVPALALVGRSAALRARLRTPWARRAAATLVLVAGLGVLAVRAAPSSSEDEVCHVPVPGSTTP